MGFGPKRVLYVRNPKLQNLAPGSQKTAAKKSDNEREIGRRMADGQRNRRKIGIQSSQVGRVAIKLIYTHFSISSVSDSPFGARIDKCNRGQVQNQCIKYQVKPSQIFCPLTLTKCRFLVFNFRYLYRKSKQGILAKIDDDMLRFYCNEDVFLMQVSPS